MLNVIYQIASNNYYNMFFILIYLYLFACANVEKVSEGGGLVDWRGALLYCISCHF